jgi:hypothetical protein
MADNNLVNQLLNTLQQNPHVAEQIRNVICPHHNIRWWETGLIRFLGGLLVGFWGGWLTKGNINQAEVQRMVNEAVRAALANR